MHVASSNLAQSPEKEEEELTWPLPRHQMHILRLQQYSS
jgi:hypothetical protein